MKYSNIQNNIILEGAWGLGKTSVAHAFSKQFHYSFIPEPSHRSDERQGSITDLQAWYRQAHREQASVFVRSTPCILERSLLSVYAFEYARDGRLPSQEDVRHLQKFLQDNQTLLVVLLPLSHEYDAAAQLPHMVESVQTLLSDAASVARYFEFYEHILPWRLGIAPLLLDPLDIPNGRDADAIALEIRTAMGAQRVGQVNVVCFNSSQTGGLQVLMLKRTPNRGGFWQAITGGIHPGEILPFVATREVQEETSFLLNQEDLLPTLFSHRFMGGDGYPLVEYVFAARIHSPEDLLLSQEHDTSQWTSVDEARKMLAYASNRLALDRAVETIVKDPPRDGGGSSEV